MFLDNEEKIIDWLKENLYYDSYSEVKGFFDELTFKDEDGYLVVNSISDIHLNLEKNEIKELPIKFGTINGYFRIEKSYLESFKGFPTIIKGSLTAINSNFKGDLKWDVKYVEGYINLCGENCELSNLNFLENTKFESFDLQIADSVFKNNKNIYDIIPNIELAKSNKLSKEELKQVLEFYKNEEEINNYLESFDIDLTKEIK